MVADALPPSSSVGSCFSSVTSDGLDLSASDSESNNSWIRGSLPLAKVSDGAPDATRKAPSPRTKKAKMKSVSFEGYLQIG